MHMPHNTTQKLKSPQLAKTEASKVFQGRVGVGGEDYMKDCFISTCCMCLGMN